MRSAKVLIGTTPQSSSSGTIGEAGTTNVEPPLYNSYELGFRVPLIAIGPYAKKGYVSHHQHEFGSILRFVENAFGLGSLGTTDVRADDLSDCFNFSRPARTFVPIPTGHVPNYFLRQPISLRDPDDDF